MSQMITDIINGFKGKNVQILAGKAGTGKTTLIAEIIAEWRGEVILLAYSGRAVQRLIEVTGHDACTIHSAVFAPPESDAEGTPNWTKVRKLGGRDTLVVIDEAYMVGMRLLASVMKALLPGTKLLLAGDHRQLKPVNDEPQDWSQPDFELTEIFRSDGGVIDFAHAILACENADQLKALIRNPVGYEGVHRLEIKHLAPSLWKANALRNNANTMLITFTNNLRHKVNTAVRQRMGYQPVTPGSEPVTRLVPGERLLVRSNHAGFDCMNGELFIYQGATDLVDADLPEHFTQVNLVDELKGTKAITCYVVPDELQTDSSDFRMSRITDSKAWIKQVYLEKKWQEEIALIKGGEQWSQLVGPAKYTVHVNYGYCITCHSAQGCEADEIGILWSEENDWLIKKDFETAKAWFYTATTRARYKVFIWIK
jgi:hypothetical protein